MSKYGFHSGPVDDRDLMLMTLQAEQDMKVEQVEGYASHKSGYVLNQGEEGHCVAFGEGNMMNSIFGDMIFGDKECHELFCRIAEIDPFPGDCSGPRPQEGTNVRSGLQVLKDEGFITRYAFIDTVQDLALHVLNHGPAVIGVPWRSGMQSVDSRGFLNTSGRITGWHCVEVDEVRWRVDGPSWLGGPNSWGKNWGDEGRFKIWRDGMSRLLGTRGAVAATVLV